MDNILKYSFDDEPVKVFSCDIHDKKIEIHFKGHYDLIKDKYTEGPCVWIIENWESGKAKIGDEPELREINTVLGIFNLILYARQRSDHELEMLVNTLDNRYLTLFFKKPVLRLM